MITIWIIIKSSNTITSLISTITSYFIYTGYLFCQWPLLTRRTSSVPAHSLKALPICQKMFIDHNICLLHKNIIKMFSNLNLYLLHKNTNVFFLQLPACLQHLFAGGRKQSPLHILRWTFKWINAFQMFWILYY